MEGYDFEGIRARHPLPEFFEARGVSLKRVGGYFVGKCPFHQEHKGMALLIYPDARRWECRGKCGAGGDVVDAFGRFEGVDTAEAARRLSDGDPDVAPRSIPAVVTPEERPRPRPTLPSSWREPSATELRALERLRAIAFDPLCIAVDRGFLWVYDDAREGLAWALTDQEQRLVIVRRLDGQPWEYRNGEWVEDPAERSKSKNLYHSQGNWPLGIREAQAYPAIGLVEGAPNFLAVIAHAWASGVEDDVAPVCLSGAGQRIADEALPLFAGKRVRIFADDDQAGYGAAETWGTRLRAVGTRVDAFSFRGLTRSDGGRVKDLNDLLRADYDCWEQNRDVIEGIMGFAFDRREAR